VGASLLAKTALLPTHFFRLYVDRIVGASLLAMAILRLAWIFLSGYISIAAVTTA
jgi:hypothetical protein